MATEGRPTEVDDLVLEAVERRTRRLNGVLHEVERTYGAALAQSLENLPSSLACAVIEHLETSGQRAKAPASALAIEAIPALLASLMVETRSGYRLVAQSLDVTSTEVLASARISLLDRTLAPARSSGARLSRVLDLISGLGGFDYVRLAFGVLILTIDVPNDRIVHASHGRLIGTVFSNVIEDDIRFGEMVVHESAHSTLSMCTQAMDEGLDSHATFWSPWRHRERPLLPYLQGVFAFCNVARYLELVLANGLAAAEVEPTLRMRLDRVTSELETCSEHFEEVSKLIDPRLARLVRQAWNSASHGSSDDQ